MARVGMLLGCAAVVGVLLLPLCGCPLIQSGGATDGNGATEGPGTGVSDGTTGGGTNADGPAIVITAPADIAVNADLGRCTAKLCPGPASAAGGCDPQPNVAAVRSDGLDSCADPYPVGETLVTWTATDSCNSQQSSVQKITVLPLNNVHVKVGLQGGVASSVTRCITFEFWHCGGSSGQPTIVEADLTFAGGVAEAELSIPCGSDGYTCVTARDKLHTLRRTLDPLPIVDGQYVADFVAAGKPLIGGNLNDDHWIDTLDFGIYVFQFGTNYGSGSTPRGTQSPNADINGDGVAWVEDFTFITLKYLQGAEANCCGAADTSPFGPTTSITVAGLQAMGLGYLAVADINGNGVVDADDIAAFMQQQAAKRPG